MRTDGSVFEMEDLHLGIRDKPSRGILAPPKNGGHGQAAPIAELFLELLFPEPWARAGAAAAG